MSKQAVTMRELQKMSAATIKALPHAVPIQSDGETVAFLTPLKAPDSEAWMRVLNQIEAHHAQLSPDTKAWLEHFLDARQK